MRKHYRILAALLLLPGSALADPAALNLGARAQTTTRFLPLNYTKAMTAPPRVDNHLRSDREAMAKGFMRLDRDMLRAPMVVYDRPALEAAAKPAVAPATQVANIDPMPASPIGHVDNAVLELFGDSDATQTPEFQNVMRTLPGRMKQAWPLPASSQQHISSTYGNRPDPFTHKAAFHSGVDISASAGTPVLASGDGVVSDIGQGGRFGKYITVNHRDGIQSMYGHLSAQTVHVGQQVRQGQMIGAVGSTGRSTGPHLHYTLKRNDQLVDPMLSLNVPTRSTNLAQR